MSTDLEKAVEKGILYLDDKLPNWREVVDWDHLNMQDPAKCVLGQALGYRKTVGEHGHDGGKWAEDHGFFTSAKGDSTKEKYLTLELLWQKNSGR